MSNVNNWNQTYDRIDALIRAFHLAEAREQLNQIVIAEIPFEMRARIAQLSRRCDDIPRAIKILTPNIFGVAETRDEDLIEYASTIRRAGLIHQSLRLLERVKKHPLVHLHRGFCHINVWQYREAKAELETYLDAADPQDYQYQVAKVNLMSAHVALSEFDTALEVFQQLQPTIKSHPYLSAGLNELRAQVHFFRNEDQACINLLNEIESDREQKSGALLFMAKKWRTLCMARSNPDPALAADFRAAARREGQFENLRFFDLYWALMHNDEALLQHVYFGSPSSAFRSLIPWTPSTSTYIWKGREPHEDGPADPLNIQKLPFGLTLHRLALTLMSDFYQPWSVPRIHDLLFTEEQYDPILSTKKVYNLLARLKKMFTAKTPYELKAGEAGYRLRPRRTSGVLIHHSMNFASPTALVAAALKEKVGDQPFSSSELAVLVPIKKSQCQTHLTSLLEDGYAVRLGRGRFRIKAA